MFVMVVLGLFGGESAAGLTVTEWIPFKEYIPKSSSKSVAAAAADSQQRHGGARHSIYTERERVGKLRWCVFIVGKGSIDGKGVMNGATCVAIDGMKLGREGGKKRKSTNNCNGIQDNYLEKANIIICWLFFFYTLLFPSPLLLCLSVYVGKRTRWSGLTMSR